jgi:hypothetical protein
LGPALVNRAVTCGNAAFLQVSAMINDREIRAKSSERTMALSPIVGFDYVPGTTTVPVADTTVTGSASTSDADGDRSGAARQTTIAEKSNCLLRRPTAVNVAVTSMTSPARTGA